MKLLGALRRWLLLPVPVAEPERLTPAILAENVDLRISHAGQVILFSNLDSLTLMTRFALTDDDGWSLLVALTPAESPPGMPVRIELRERRPGGLS